MVLKLHGNRLFVLHHNRLHRIVRDIRSYHLRDRLRFIRGILRHFIGRNIDSLILRLFKGRW
jgi:hypothetical protein